MLQFDDLFENVKHSDNFEENARLIQYVGNVLQHTKKIDAKETEAIRNFAVSEMERLIPAISRAETYREKDKIFFYENSLLMIFTHAGENTEGITEAQMETVKKLVMLVSKECVVENTVDELFKSEKTEKAEIEKAIEIVKPLKDEYQRSIFYQKLNDYSEKLRKLSAEAKGALAEFVAEDMNRMLNDPDGLDDDQINSLEFAADICSCFISEEILEILERVMSLKINRVRYYALKTLLENKKAVSSETVRELAEDLTYAELTYRLLETHKKSDLFPAEYAVPEYLAKSDLVHWLTYPTELGKEPDEISLLGAVKVKRETYHVFKYKSDSETLSDDLQNVDLIGWSGDGGGTFSNFDKLSDYEKKTPQKTLKNIAKKLLK